MTVAWLQQYLDRVRKILRRKRLIMATVEPLRSLEHASTFGPSMASFDPSAPSAGRTPDQVVVAPSSEAFSWQLPAALSPPLPPPPLAPKVQRTCLVCEDMLDEDMFPHQCTKCTAYSYCRTCLKEWFLESCKNESRMPPKCCAVIPISAMANLLTSAQVSALSSLIPNWH